MSKAKAKPKTEKAPVGGIGGTVAPKAHQFQPGQSGNPGGKPIGARNALNAKFLTELAKDFHEHGAEAIQKTREQHPDRYVAIVAGLQPKELVIEKPFDGISDDELAGIIAHLRSLVGDAEKGDRGDGAPTQH